MATRFTAQQLTAAYREAPHYTEADAFVSDMLLSAAFLDPDDEAAEPDLSQAEALRRVWNVANLSFRDLLREMGTTQSALSRAHCIPLRTVQGWALGEREAPPYLRLMIARIEKYI